MSDLRWTCALHGLVTRGDCGRCDDELIALIVGHAGLAEGDLFVAPDGDNEPTLWRRTERPHFPAAVLRRCDLAVNERDLWGRITTAATGGA